MDTNSLLANIIRNARHFSHQKEFLNYHRTSASLESAINARKIMEYNTTKAKYDLLKEKLEKYDMQKKNFIDKEKKILENIKEYKKEYQKYLNEKS